MPHGFWNCSNRNATSEPVQVRRRGALISSSAWAPAMPRRFVQGSAARAARSFFRRVKRRGVRFPLTHVSAFADPACLGMRSIRDGLGPVTVAFDGLNPYYGVVCLAPVSLCGLAPTSGTAQRLMVIRAVPLEDGTRGSVARRYPTNDRRFSVG